MGFEIAIDGPGGSGKSTVAQAIAKTLGFVYIDTGAMYRSVALYCLQKKIDVKNEQAVTDALDDMEMALVYKNDRQCVILNGVDVTDELRTAETGKASSAVAVYRNVRERLVLWQQQLAEKGNVVMDGRDIGTHVLPNAHVKIYLDASPDVRAQRRCGELKTLGQPFDFETIKREIIERDKNDMTREISPLKKAEDAIFIDTSLMDRQEVELRIVQIIKEKM